MNIGQVLELHLGMAARELVFTSQHQYSMVRKMKTYGELLQKRVWLVMRKQFYMMDVQVNHSITVCQ